MKNHVTVVAAIIIDKNEILCVQRKENKFSYISKKYEFPGGKVESGETEEKALKREIKEELEMDIFIREKIVIVSHEYPDFSITMHCFSCGVQSRDLQLKDHLDYKWLKPDDMDKLDWAAADMPIVEKLRGVIQDG